MVLALVLLTIAPSAQVAGAEEIAKWVRRLGADTLEAREEATEHLKRFGGKAKPQLEKAALHSEAEVATRARFLLERLRVLEFVTEPVARALPGIEDRLAAKLATWHETYLKATDLREPVTAQDTEPLAGPALRSVPTYEFLQSVSDRVFRMNHRSAIPVLMSLIKSEKKNGDGLVAEALGNLRATETVGELGRLLEEGTLRERRFAILALGHLRARAWAPRIAEQMGHPGLVYDCARSLKLMRDPSVIPKLLPHLSNSKPVVRRMTLRTLGALESVAAVAPVAGRLDDPDFEVRKGAIDALRELGFREAVPHLVPLISDENPKIRDGVGWTLKAIGAPECVAPLRRMLADPHEDVREEAASGLGYLRAHETIPDLLPLLEDEKLRTTVISALGMLRSREAVPRLLAFSRSDDYVARLVAVRALAKIGTREAIPVFIERLGEKEKPLRAAAADALGMLEAKEAVPELIRLARGKGKPESRVQAVRALGQIASPESRDPLKELLSDPEGTVRGAAARALGSMGVRGAWPEILKQLDDMHPAARAGAAEAAGMFRSREAFPRLLELYDDDNNDVAVAAAGAVDSCYGPEHADLIRAQWKLKKWYYRTRVVDYLSLHHPEEALPLLKTLLRRHRFAFWGDMESAALRMDLEEILPELRERLSRPDRGSRVSASCVLVRMGSPEGIPILLSQDPHSNNNVGLATLIAYRHPRFRSLLDHPLEVGTRHESLAAFWRKVAERLGLKLVLPPGKDWDYPYRTGYADPFRLYRHLTENEGRTTFLLAVYYYLQEGWTVLVEGDTLRIVSNREAEAHWRAWWAQEQKRLGR